MGTKQHFVLKIPRWDRGKDMPWLPNVTNHVGHTLLSWSPAIIYTVKLKMWFHSVVLQNISQINIYTCSLFCASLFHKKVTLKRFSILITILSPLDEIHVFPENDRMSMSLPEDTVHMQELRRLHINDEHRRPHYRHPPGEKLVLPSPTWWKNTRITVTHQVRSLYYRHPLGEEKLTSSSPTRWIKLTLPSPTGWGNSPYRHPPSERECGRKTMILFPITHSEGFN